MHELGIVFHVIKQVEEVAEQNKVEKVVELTLEVGEVSTVVPSYFKDCYDWAIKRSKYMKECKLNLIVVKAISFCKTCQKTYDTIKGKICPHCGSEDTYLVSGDKVMIKDVKVI